MKTFRIALAIAAGILLAWAFSSRFSEDLNASQTIPGLFLGFGVTFSMIRHSEKITLKSIWFFLLPLLLILVIYIFFTETIRSTLTASIWSVAYLAIHFGFVWVCDRLNLSESNQPHQIDQFPS